NPYAYTQGMADIFEGKHLFFLANKAKKAQIVKQSLQGPITEDVPASILQKHPKVTVVLDREAASFLENDTLADKPFLPRILWLPIYSAEGRVLSTSSVKKDAASSATVSKLDQNVELKVGQLLNDFSFPLDDIKKTISAFVRDAHKGLAGRKSSLKMLPTFVDNPTGKETGHFLALDLGGSNFRVLMVDLKGDASKPAVAIKRFKLTRHHTSKTGNVLFAAIANFIKKFLVEQGYKSSYDLGFTFSFPVKQTQVNEGILINWAKGFTAKGVVGKNVVYLLNQSLKNKGVRNVNVVAIDNDTTGTQVARAYRDPDCDMGVILATGTNICARLPVSMITKPFRRLGYHSSHMIVNFESGNFNKLLPRNKYDEMLDRNSENRDKQWAEKMVSGKYLGEVGRLALKDLAENGFLFKGRVPWILAKPGRFTTKMMGEVEALRLWTAEALSTLKSRDFFGKHENNIKVSQLDAELIQFALNLISDRAAKIAAAAIIGAIKVSDPHVKRRHTIAVDGSLFQKYPLFKNHIQQTFKRILGSKASNIKMQLTSDGSGVGAAIIAAVASKQKSASSAADFQRISAQIYNLVRLPYVQESKQINSIYQLIVYLVKQMGDFPYRDFRFPYESAKVARYVCPAQNWQKVTELLESIQPQDSASVVMSHLIVTPGREANNYILIMNEQLFKQPFLLFFALVHELAGHIAWIEKSGITGMVHEAKEEAVSAQAEQSFIESAIKNAAAYLRSLKGLRTTSAEDLAFLEKVLDPIQLQNGLRVARERVKIYGSRKDEQSKKEPGRGSSAATGTIEIKRNGNGNVSSLILSEQDLKIKRKVIRSQWNGEKKEVISLIKFNDDRTPFKLAKFTYGEDGKLIMLELIRVREKGKLTVRRPFQFHVPISKGSTMHFIYRKVNGSSRKKVPYISISEAGNGIQLLSDYELRERIIDRSSGKTRIKRMQVSLLEYNEDSNNAVLDAYQLRRNEENADNSNLAASEASSSAQAKPDFAVLIHPAPNDSISLTAYRRALEGVKRVVHIGHSSNLFYLEVPGRIRQSGAQFINPAISDSGSFRPPSDFRKRVLFAGGDVKSSLLTAIQHVAKQAFEEGDKEITAEIDAEATYLSRPHSAPYSLEETLQKVERGENLQGFFNASRIKKATERIPEFLIHLFSGYKDQNRDFETSFLAKYKTTVMMGRIQIGLNPDIDSKQALIIKIIRPVKVSSATGERENKSASSSVFVPGRIGILTGGGPASGHNQVIYAAFKKAQEQGISLIAIQNGWHGLFKESLIKKAHKLALREIEPYHTMGGTVLGTSRFNPYEAKNLAAGVPQKIWENIKNLKLDGLITLGGDDTNGVTGKLSAEHPDFPFIGLPKTMDNDLNLPHISAQTYGFDTFTQRGAEALRWGIADAKGRRAILVVEVFGRNAGFVAMRIGKLVGATRTLIPEKHPVALNAVIRDLVKHHKKHGYAVLVVSEGVQINLGYGKNKEILEAGFAKDLVAKAIFEKGESDLDAFGHPKLEGVGVVITAALKNHPLVKKNKIHVMQAGKIDYLFRSAPTSDYDMRMCGMLGEAAVSQIMQGNKARLLYVVRNNVKAIDITRKLGGRHIDLKNVASHIKEFKQANRGLASSAQQTKVILEIDARALVKTFNCTIGKIPKRFWDDIRKLGIDVIWFKGVWQKSPLSERCMQWLKGHHQEKLERWASAYDVYDYKLDSNFAKNDEEFEAVSGYLKSKGIKTILDFVTNHFSADNPLAKHFPWLFFSWENFEQAYQVACRLNPAMRIEKEVFLRDWIGDKAPGEIKLEDLPCRCFHRIGKYAMKTSRYSKHDPDMGNLLQVNYLNRQARQFMVDTILGGKIAKLTLNGGFRADLAHLALRHRFFDRWTDALGLKWQEFEKKMPDEFWQRVVSMAKAKGMLPVAEAFDWDENDKGKPYNNNSLVGQLQRLGLITYDSVIYEGLKNAAISSADIRGWIDRNNVGFKSIADFDAFFENSLHYTENHDEAPYRFVFGKYAPAATAVSFAIPGYALLTLRQLLNMDFPAGVWPHHGINDKGPDMGIYAYEYDKRITTKSLGAIVDKDLKKILRLVSQPAFRKGSLFHTAYLEDKEGGELALGRTPLVPVFRYSEKEIGLVIINHNGLSQELVINPDTMDKYFHAKYNGNSYGKKAGALLDFTGSADVQNALLEQAKGYRLGRNKKIVITLAGNGYVLLRFAAKTADKAAGSMALASSAAVKTPILRPAYQLTLNNHQPAGTEWSLRHYFESYLPVLAALALPKQDWERLFPHWK
ncbi:MAG: 6-phosphofructokinase, partial [Candidatus Omnitrophica bacterium]|nr:6-phosphofructokinase [Candidatus Omnitrophota bacterium]